jgi:hypothetical protein
VDTDVILGDCLLDQAVGIPAAPALQKSIILAAQEVAAMKSGEAQECRFASGVSKPPDGRYALVICHQEVGHNAKIGVINSGPS